MKISVLAGGQRRARFEERGLTLTELLVTMALGILVSMAVVASQIYGARMTEFTHTKIHTSDKARQWMRLLTSDIQSARLIQVGTGTASTFTEAAPDTLQQGNALQIYPTTDPNVFVRYVRLNSDEKLKRIKSDGSVAELAAGISNVIVFAQESINGAVVSNRQQNAVIAIDLQFNRIENPNLPVGPGHHYKSYRFQTRIAQPKML